MSRRPDPRAKGARPAALASVAAVLLLLAPGGAPAGPRAAPPEACVASGRAGVVAAAPFDLYQHHLYVEASVQGRGPHPFILDTGAPVTAVDAGLASRLRRPVRDEGSSRGVGPSPVRTGALPGTRVSVADLEVERGRVVSMAVDSVVGSLTGRTTHGIVGYPFFRDRVVELDFDARCVRVHDPAAYRPAAEALVLPLEARGAWPRTRGILQLPDGRAVDAELLVDTGARLSLLLTSDFVEAEELRAALPDRVRGASAAGLGGATRLDLARVPALRLDTLRYREPIVGVATGRGLRIGAFDAILGTELLRRFRVVIDDAGGRLILEPGRRRHAPEEFDMSGLVLAARDAGGGRRIVVEEVASGTPGAEAGVRAGDVIVAVDGEPADGLDLGRIEGLLEGPSGATRTLRVRRGDELLTLVVVLRRLI